MRPPYNRAARLRQAILRRVDNHLCAWLYGDDTHASKMFREIDDLIVELIQETKNSSE